MPSDLENSINVEDDGGVRTVTLNRPDRLNAINYDLLDRLEAVAQDSHRDPAVHAVVLRGNGRAFCAGDDIKGMGTERNPIPESPTERAELGYPRFINAIRQAAKPFIAEVHGYALGAGCDLALSCDIVFAASDAELGLVFTQRGMVSGTALVTQVVGYQSACELLFSGRRFGAAEARQLGLVNHVVPSGGLREEVAQRARELANGPTTAIGLIKRALNQSRGASLESALKIQQHVVGASYGTNDYAEGRTAFLQGRKPRFHYAGSPQAETRSY